MALKLEMLRVFQTVAEQGSLSSAAAKLGRTPSAVSMMLSQLEEDIGDRLFESDRCNKKATAHNIYGAERCDFLHEKREQHK